MAWKEKQAWVSFLAILLVYPVYFYIAANQVLSVPQMLAYYALACGVQIVIMVITLGIMAARNPGEANARADERDRDIDKRATSVAYLVLMLGTILVGVVMPFRDHGLKIVNSALFALIFAEAVRYGVTIYGYRMPQHG